MNPGNKVAFYTLGCKLNFSESSTIARKFQEYGYARVDMADGPDVLVINTCSVTENADKKCRRIVRQALGQNPELYVAVIGCYAQLKPEEIASIPGVDIVLGASEKFNLPDHIESLQKENTTRIEAGPIKEVREFIPSYSKGDRTRTFLKVQDGCDYFCSFCTIPLARGRSRSNSIASTMKVAREVAQTEVKEVVLTGVNIGDFGKGTDENFLQLIRDLDDLEGIDRFRISSIEPNLLSDEIIDFVARSQRFVPHFHIPLQSGADELLSLMRRRYQSALYTDRVAHIKRVMPQACIGVDVIVGYPGETEAHFETTMNFLKELDVSYLHVFTYSERANTTAVRSEDVVPMDVRRQRSKMLQMLSLKKKRKFYEDQLNTTQEVLFETEDHDGFIHGFTANYVKVAAPYNKDLVNTVQRVELLQINADDLVDVHVLSPVESLVAL